MVLTKDRRTNKKAGDSLLVIPLAVASKIFAGGLVNLDASGNGVSAVDTAGHAFAGVAKEMRDQSVGDAQVLLEYRGVIQMTATGITAAQLLEDAFVVDDETVGLGITAQPVNVTGVAVSRTANSKGGVYALAFTATGTLLGYGGGATVNVGAGGTFVLTATDGSTVEVVVTGGSIPGANQIDNLALRNVKVGKIVEVVSATSVYIDMSK